jgi:hypothetical protein
MLMEAIQRNVTWRAIPFAGLAAGIAHLVTLLVLTPVMLDTQPVLPLRYMGSLVLGQDVLMDTNATTLIVGLVVHFILSIFFALIIAIVVHRWGLAVGIIGGALLGLCSEAINVYTMTCLFEWVFAVHSTVSVIAHLVFGAVAGGVYEMYDHYDLPIELEEKRKNV